MVLPHPWASFYNDFTNYINPGVLMITVHLETLKSTPTSRVCGKKTITFDRQTVEITVTLGQKADRREVQCHTRTEGCVPGAPLECVTIYGLAVRFSSGNKIWPGSATYWVKSGNVNNLCPNIDKRGYFSLAGFAEDYTGKAVRSQHNAVA